MSKRGQIVGQPFLMILALVVAALVLFFGTQQVMKLLQTAGDVEAVHFKQTLEQEIASFRTFEVGSSKILAVDAPSKVSSICFTEKKQLTQKNLGKDFETLWEKTSRNVYLLPLDAYPKYSSFELSGITLAGTDNPLCVHAQGGKISIRIESMMDEGQLVIQIGSAA